MSDRYERLFTCLGSTGRTALIPFLVLGDPDPLECARLLEAVVAAGADALELGIPFSDPVADGPVIQAAATRALRAGTTPAVCWDLIAAVRRRSPDLPIGLLVYANLVVRPGLDQFYRQAADVGVDSVLVADLPVSESGPFRDAALRHGVAPVQIAPPGASAGALTRIAAASRGYTYVTSRRGVTGHGDPGAELAVTIHQLRSLGAPPSVVGFGIARPAHVTAVRAAGGAGAIVGSALVAAIDSARAAGADPAAAATTLVRTLKEAAAIQPIARGALQRKVMPMPTRPAPRRRRAPLTRERILAAALGLADRHGLEALTMRALGEALSVEAMSLYNHVSGKADLLTGIGDLVLDQIHFGTEGDHWRDRMRAGMWSAWRATGAHPNVVPLLLGSPSDTPGSRALAERVLAALVPAGFAPAEAHRIYRLAQTYTLGSVLMLQRTPTPRAVRSMVTALEKSGDFPFLRQALIEGPEIDGQADFEAGIDLILKGIPSPRTRVRGTRGRGRPATTS